MSKENVGWPGMEILAKQVITAGAVQLEFRV